LLRAFPTMPATVIAERIGWPYSIRTLSGRVADLRPVYLPPNPASRTTYEPGEIAQCDFWFPDVTLPVGFGQHRTVTQLPVLTMVTRQSRWDSAVPVPSRRAEDLYASWWQLVSALGAVPRVLVWDGEGAVGRWRARHSELTAECQAFRGTLAAKVLTCRPADPEAKGLVERLHHYLERSFLPGRNFSSNRRRPGSDDRAGSPACTAKCPPESPTAARAASAPPGSWPAEPLTPPPVSRLRATCPRRSSTSCAGPSPPNRRGSSPRVALPPTKLQSAASASKVRRFSASSSPVWYQCSNRYQAPPQVVS
jgi:transposase